MYRREDRTEETEDEVTVNVRVNYNAMKCWAMQYGYYVRIISPPALVEKVKKEITSAARSYETDDNG